MPTQGAIRVDTLLRFEAPADKIVPMREFRAARDEDRKLLCRAEATERLQGCAGLKAAVPDRDPESSTDSTR
jgi:hypothetical protein